VNDKFVTGLNFNFLPNDVRARIMDLIVESNQKFYQEIETSNINSIKVNNPLGSILISDKGVSSFLLFVKSKTGLDVSKCVRTYDRKNIMNVRLIEYDEWHYIPYLSFKDSIRGSSLANVQRDIIIGSES
jgi:hypothetical protein